MWFFLQTRKVKQNTTGDCTWHKFNQKQRSVFDCYRVYARIGLPSGSMSRERVIYGDVDILSQRVSLVFSKWRHFYRRQRSCGKVMFLHLSVILFTEGGLPDRDPYRQNRPWTETPPGQRPPGQRSPWPELPLNRDPSWTETPWTETPSQNSPWTETPPGQTPLWTDPPPPTDGDPLDRDPLDRDPLDRDPPGQRSLGQRTPGQQPSVW